MLGDVTAALEHRAEEVLVAAAIAAGRPVPPLSVGAARGGGRRQGRRQDFARRLINEDAARSLPVARVSVCPARPVHLAAGPKIATEPPNPAHTPALPCYVLEAVGPQALGP
jgi:hypothetical protein